jgi:hypothetical protein
MTYRLIDTGMWNDPWFEELPADSKLVFVYLFTNPHANSSGSAQYSMKRIANETSLSSDRVRVIVGDLEAAGKIVVDGPWIACRSFIRHQTRNGNFALSVGKSISELPEGKVKTMATEEAGKVKPSRRNPPATPPQEGSKEDATPPQPKSNPEATLLLVLDQGQDQEKETPPTPRKRGNEFSPSFEEWWKTYPRKEEKHRAYAKYRARLKEGATDDELLTIAKNYAHFATGVEAKYVKHPATILNGDWREWLTRREPKPKAKPDGNTSGASAEDIAALARLRVEKPDNMDWTVEDRRLYSRVHPPNPLRFD